MNPRGKPWPSSMMDGAKLQDGYDTVEWIRSQSWCDGRNCHDRRFGRVASHSFLLAGSEPEGITGQIMGLTPGSLYHGFAFADGAFRKELAEGWLLNRAVALSSQSHYVSFSSFLR